MKERALYHLHRYITLGILVVTITTVLVLGLYTYRNISETITTTARLIELRPEIAITEQLNVAMWTKIKEQVLEKAGMQSSPEITVTRDPFAP